MGAKGSGAATHGHAGHIRVPGATRQVGSIAEKRRAWAECRRSCVNERACPGTKAAERMPGELWRRSQAHGHRWHRQQTTTMASGSRQAAKGRATDNHTRQQSRHTQCSTRKTRNGHGNGWSGHGCWGRDTTLDSSLDSACWLNTLEEVAVRRAERPGCLSRAGRPRSTDRRRRMHSHRRPSVTDHLSNDTCGCCLTCE